MTEIKDLEVIDKVFQEANTINSQVDNISCGGCGVFAEHLYKVFVKLGYKPTLKLITVDPIGMAETLANNGAMSYHTEINHIVVELNGLLIDNRRVGKGVGDFYAFPMGHRLIDGLTIELLEKWNADRTYWNSRFDSNHIPTIIDKLEKVYEKVKKDLVVS